MSPTRAMELSYENMEDLIRSIAWEFWRTYKGHPDELLSEACEHFVDAYFLHAEERGQFSTWLKYYIWKQLLTTKKRQSRMAKRVVIEDVVLESIPYKGRSFNPTNFSSELSTDAAIAVGIALDPPLRMLKTVKKKGRKAASMRVCLRHELKRIGWKRHRIAKAFEEVRRSL